MENAVDKHNPILKIRVSAAPISLPLATILFRDLRGLRSKCSVASSTKCPFGCASMTDHRRDWSDSCHPAFRADVDETRTNSPRSWLVNGISLGV